jgi:hypothetical protein
MMIKPGRRVLAAAMLAAAVPAWVTASAYAAMPRAGDMAAVPGWRVLAAGRLPGGSLNSVIALSPRVAWAGGGPSRATGKAVIEHWHGGRWTVSKLPSGLSGTISELSASSWNNVWAFGGPVHGNGGFALRWNGHRWRVMKRWSTLTSVAGVVVRSPVDVWVFSRVNGFVQHYNGHSWQAVRVVANVSSFESVTSLPNGAIWAITGGLITVIVRGTVSKSGVYTWRTTALTGYPDPGTGGPPLTNLYARSATDVWAVGGGVRVVSGHDRWYPLLAHWNGHAWQRIKVSGTFRLGECNPVGDRHGGLWLTTGWDSTGVPPHLMHFTGGRLVRVSMPPRDGRYVGVISLANIPATASVWGAGALTGLGALGATTGVILKYGR